MKWTYRRIGWCASSIVGSAIEIICTFIMICLTTFFLFTSFLPILYALSSVFALFAVVVILINIYFTFKPSSIGFLVILLVAIISVIYQAILTGFVFLYINYSIGDRSEEQWHDKFKELGLDGIQKQLHCCGYSNYEDNPGRNGFCYRTDISPRPPGCLSKIMSDIIQPLRIAAIFLAIAAAFNVVAIIFAVLLRKSNPDDEFSPDNETMLAAGLL